MILGVSHVGIAVPDIDVASALWSRLLGSPERLRSRSDTQGVIASFIPVGNSEVELVQPTSADSGIGRFVARNGKSAIHHVCFQVDDIELEVQRLVASGAQLLTPGAMPDDEGPFRAYAWIHQQSFGGVLVELVQHRD